LLGERRGGDGDRDQDDREVQRLKVHGSVGLRVWASA
jgi:hypothetical protein